MKETDIVTLLKSYSVCKKFLHSQEYAKDFFDPDDTTKLDKKEQYEARMNVIESLIQLLEPSNEYTLLHLHYINGFTVEQCAESMYVSRTTAFRMLKRGQKSIMNLLNRRATDERN